MEGSSNNQTIVCIVGLGYVGYPLAEAFSHHATTIGFDIDEQKIKLINQKSTKLFATSDPVHIRKADFVMICVPTLLTPENEPDLSYVRSAASIVGRQIKKGVIVVLESTVFPGVTEEIVMPILEKESGYCAGKDFWIGYSPERINPGDPIHVLSKITKIVAGMDPVTTEKMAEVYGLITNVYRAPDIRTAEAAKVVENIQRDVNIALINEFSQIFNKIGLNTKDILEAAGTKWNFHHYTPGIVGGHCIPTVPYFLVYKAKQYGFNPNMILAGRSTNDHMTRFIADIITDNLIKSGKKIHGASIVILGLTYKENVADTRDNPIIELIRHLKDQNIYVFGYDPLLSKAEIMRISVIPLESLDRQVDGYVLAVPHEQFITMKDNELIRFAGPDILFIDLKGVFFKEMAFKKLFRYITL